MGRLVLWRMNASHSKVTDWGLAHLSIGPRSTILDVGCGGGRTLGKLAAAAIDGKVYGVDYSEESVRVSRGFNARWIREGRLEVRHGAVSALPFLGGMFDIVTAVETHFWWPDLPAGLQEIRRVLKPGGKLIIIAEVYKGAETPMAKMIEEYGSRTGMTLLDADEHSALLSNADYSEVQVTVEPGKGWICAIGKKP